MEQQELISDDNTYIGKIVHYWDTRGLPKKKINIILKDGITMVAYIPVSVLPTPGQAEEGVFYITPDDVIHYIRGGVWHSMEPDGEDNVIEIIKTADGTELPVDPSDKSVTLPEDLNTTYTFEDVLVNGKLVGWRVRNNDTGLVVYTHSDLDTKSDGTYFTSTNLETSVGGETTVPLSTITDIIAEKIVLGETLLYDANGTVAVVNSKTSTSVTATTIAFSEHHDGVWYTNMLFNPSDISSNHSRNVMELWDHSNIGGKHPDPGQVVPYETLVWDAKGTVGVVTASAGNTVNIRVITNTKEDESDGVWKVNVSLDKEISGLTTFSESNVPDRPTVAGKHWVINESLFFDDDGTLARLKVFNASDNTLVAETITTSTQTTQVYYTEEWLENTLHQTAEVARTRIYDLATKTTNPAATAIKVNETFITDNKGTLGVVVGYASNIATIETIATNTNPYIVKLSNRLSDVVGEATAVDALDLKDWHGNIIEETNIAIDKTLVFDVTRACIGLVTAFSSGTAAVTTIYSSDSPYVFETTAHSLPDLGEAYTDLNLAAWRTDTTSADGSQYLEEWNMIVGKTMIINRLEGKIAVITEVNKTDGYFTVKTVYASKAGETLSLVPSNTLTGAIGGYGDYYITDLARASLLTLDDISTIVPYQTMVWDKDGKLGVVFRITDATTGLIGIRTIATNLNRPIFLRSSVYLPKGINDISYLSKNYITPSLPSFSDRSPFYPNTMFVHDADGTTAIVQSEEETRLVIRTISISGIVLTEYDSASGVAFSGEVGGTMTHTVSDDPSANELPLLLGKTRRIRNEDIGDWNIVCRDSYGTWALLDEHIYSSSASEWTFTWRTFSSSAPRVFRTEDLNHSIDGYTNLAAADLHYAEIGSGSHPSDSELNAYLQSGKTLCFDEQGRIAVYNGKNTGATPIEYQFKTILVPNAGGKYYVLRSTELPLHVGETTIVNNSEIYDQAANTPVDLTTFSGGEIVYDDEGTLGYWVGFDPTDNTKSQIKTGKRKAFNFFFYKPTIETQHLNPTVGQSTTISYSAIRYLANESTANVNRLVLGESIIIDYYTGTVGLYVGANVPDDEADIKTLISPDVAGRYLVAKSSVGDPKVVFNITPNSQQSIDNSKILDPITSTAINVSQLRGGEIIYDEFGTQAYWVSLDPNDNTKSIVKTAYDDDRNFIYFSPVDNTIHLDTKVGNTSTVPYSELVYLEDTSTAVPTQALREKHTFVLDRYVGTIGLYIGENASDSTKADILTVSSGSGSFGKYYLLQDTETTPPEIFNRETSSITTVSNSHIIDPTTGNPIDIDLFTGGEIVYDINGTMAYWLGLDTSDNTKSRFKTAYNTIYNFVYYKPTDNTQHLDYRPRSNTSVSYSELVYINAAASTVARRELLKAGYTIVVDFYTGTTGLYMGGTGNANVMTLSSNLDKAGYYFVYTPTPTAYFSRTPLTVQSVANADIQDPLTGNAVDLSVFKGGEPIYDMAGTQAIWYSEDPDNPTTHSLVQTTYNSEYNTVYYNPADPTEILSPIIGNTQQVLITDLKSLTNDTVTVPTTQLRRFYTMVIDAHTGTKGLYINEASGLATIKTLSSGGGDRITEPEIYDIWFGEESS